MEKITKKIAYEVGSQVDICATYDTFAEAEAAYIEAVTDGALADWCGEGEDGEEVELTLAQKLLESEGWHYIAKRVYEVDEDGYKLEIECADITCTADCTKDFVAFLRKHGTEEDVAEYLHGN